MLHNMQCISFAANAKKLNFSRKYTWLLYVIILYYIIRTWANWIFGWILIKWFRISNQENLPFIQHVIKHEFSFLQSIEKLNFILRNFAILTFQIEHAISHNRFHDVYNMQHIKQIIWYGPYNMGDMIKKCIQKDFYIQSRFYIFFDQWMLRCESHHATARFKTKSIL